MVRPGPRRSMPRMRTSEAEGSTPGRGPVVNDCRSRKSAALKPMPSASTTIMVIVATGLPAK